MTVTLRREKGSALSHDELDNNFLGVIDLTDEARGYSDSALKSRHIAEASAASALDSAGNALDSAGFAAASEFKIAQDIADFNYLNNELIDDFTESAGQALEDADAAFEQQREQFDARFQSQFVYKNLGNISDVAGQSLASKDSFNAYQFPDNSKIWYGTVQSQTFPVTIPADPAADPNWGIVNGLTTADGDQRYSANFVNTVSSAVENMIAMSPVTGGSSTHAIGNVYQTYSTTWVVKSISNPMTIENFLALNAVDVTAFGATGGNATLDTAAFLAAWQTGYAVAIPPVDYDNAYVLSGECELPSVSVMTGTVRLKSPVSEAIARLNRQAYITFADADSRIVGGSLHNVRATLSWSDLMFISPGGFTSKTGTAIGRKTGNEHSAYGGKVDRISFAGFDDAWINDWAYFLNINTISLVFNNRGLSFDDWNSSSISDIYGKSGGDYYIDTGGDSARSTIRDFGFNMNSEVKIGIRFEGGVTFSGYGYFEGFGTPTVANQTCIAAACSPFNNDRPVGLENILFSMREGAYNLTIGGTSNVGHISWAGVISKCNFDSTQIAAIGYGIHDRYNGSPTYPNTMIAGLNLDTCSGVTKQDLVGTPYQVIPNTLHAYIRGKLTGYSPGSSAWERLPIENSHITVSNSTDLIDSSNRVILKKRKTYDIELTLRLRNMTDSEFVAQASLLINGVSIDSSYETVPAKLAVNQYRTITLSAMLENTSSAGQLYAQVRNSCEVVGYTLSVRQLHSEV